MSKRLFRFIHISIWGLIFVLHIVFQPTAIMYAAGISSCVIISCWEMSLRNEIFFNLDHIGVKISILTFAQWMLLMSIFFQLLIIVINEFNMLNLAISCGLFVAIMLHINIWYSVVLQFLRQYYMRPAIPRRRPVTAHRRSLILGDPYNDADLPILAPPAFTKSDVCTGCYYYSGRTDGGNRINCGPHPFGPDGDSCNDWKAEPSSNS